MPNVKKPSLRANDPGRPKEKKTKTVFRGLLRVEDFEETLCWKKRKHGAVFPQSKPQTSEEGAGNRELRQAPTANTKAKTTRQVNEDGG